MSTTTLKDRATSWREDQVFACCSLTKLCRFLLLWLQCDSISISYINPNLMSQLFYYTETLRKYPPVPIIERVCRKSYTVPGSKLSIGEGKTLMVPLLAIQRDGRYFGEPLKYKPLRFLHDKPNETQLCPSAFASFGIGGAQCVGKYHEERTHL